MANPPTPGMGNILKMEGVALAGVTGFDPNINVGEGDTTTLDSTGKASTYVPTRWDGEIQLELNWLPSATATNHGAEIMNNINNPATNAGPQVKAFTIEWNDADSTIWSFNGFFKNIGPSANRDDKAGASATIRVSGVVDWDYTAP